MSTPRKPSPLSQVLSAWDTKPATTSSETKIAKGSIQAALGRAHESLDEARYIDGLSTVFNTYFEDTEAAITDAEAARTVNKVRLKVINLPFDTSVEFICGAYVFCIEIVKKRIFFAKSRQDFSRSCELIASIKPISRASCAETGFEEMIISKDFSIPTKRGKLIVPVPPGIKPNLTSGSPNRDFGVPMRWWASIQNSNPPPSAY